MLLTEIGQLLAVIRSFDNRKLDESTARAWKIMLDRHVPDATLEQGTEVVLDWFSTANPYFEVRHLVDGLKRELRMEHSHIAADVRSAKARGLVDASWPRFQKLTINVQDRLSEVRALERAEALALGGGDDGANVSPLKLDVGRRL